MDYDEYQKAIETTYDSLMAEWKKIQEELLGSPDFDARRLRGYLLESLFYYACLKRQAFFIDVELVEMDEARSESYPPWFEATPLYDVIPTLHHVKEGEVRKRKAPQTRADFLVSYVDDRGPVAPSLVDVKSTEPKAWDSDWGWESTAALRRGFTFQLAFPIEGIEYPKELKEWEVKTPCSKCMKLSKDYRTCSECGNKVFPFTIADAYYEAKELWEKLGKERKGRF